jgi:hypothetical protein
MTISTRSLWSRQLRKRPHLLRPARTCLPIIISIRSIGLHAPRSGLIIHTLLVTPVLHYLILLLLRFKISSRKLQETQVFCPLLEGKRFLLDFQKFTGRKFRDNTLSRWPQRSFCQQHCPSLQWDCVRYPNSIVFSRGKPRR